MRTNSAARSRARGKPADADMFAVAAAGGDRRRISLAHARMFVLAGEAPIGEQIVGADQHHVDAVDGNDLVGIGERFVAFELHHEQRRGVERGIGLGGRKQR